MEIDDEELDIQITLAVHSPLGSKHAVSNRNIHFSYGQCFIHIGEVYYPITYTCRTQMASENIGFEIHTRIV